MYFADAGDLETHLNNDWTLLLKNIKAKQDMHFQLLQYNKAIVAQQRSDDDGLFVNDQILRHQAKVDKAEELFKSLQPSQKEIFQKYQGTSTNSEEITKLMLRVGARVLEAYQYSIDKCKSLNQQLIQKHEKMKIGLVKFLNPKGEINLQETTKLVVAYASNKLFAQIQRLKRIISALENGQFSKLQLQYVPIVKKPLIPLSHEGKKLSLEKTKISSVGREQRSPLREQIKAQQKIRRQKQKLAVKLAHGLYNMMELSKQQFIEQMCCVQREKGNRLYTEIFQRNRLNYNQIKAFQAKRQEYHEKIRLFKEMMERQSIKFTEIMQRQKKMNCQKPFHLQEIKIQHKKQSYQPKPEKVSLEEVIEAIEDPIERRMSFNRYRIQQPKGKRQSKQFTSHLNIEQQHEQFNHFKFDSTGQQIYARTNRNKLPNINNQNGQNNGQNMGRSTSLDQKVELNKTKIFRNYKKQIKGILEDVNNEQSFVAENGKDRLFIERNRLAIKHVQLREGRGLRGIKPQPHPMQYTFYIRKSNQKFFESNKLNALI